MPSESIDDEDRPALPINSQNFDRRIEDISPNLGLRKEDPVDSWDRGLNKVRDVLFLGLGTTGAAFELFIADPKHPVVFPIIAFLLNIPVALGLDKKRRDTHDQ